MSNTIKTIIKKTVSTLDNNSSNLKRITMEELFNSLEIYKDESTNTILINSKDSNLILASNLNIGLISQKNIIVMTGNQLDKEKKADGYFYMNVF